MKKLVLLIAAVLLFCSACSAKPQTPEFVAPTPAAEKPDPTPIPEPAPTQRPYSEYNEMLEKLRYGSTDGAGMRVTSYPETLYGVEFGSSLIVLATVLEKEHIEYQTDYGTWDSHQEGTVLVHKVYKGEDVKAGDTLRLREYINIPTYEDGSRAIISHGKYFFPTKEYGTYLLFLYPGDGDYYLPVDEYCGKYPVNPAIAEAYEADALTYDLMEILQRDWVVGGVDRNVPPQDFANIHKEVYAKYYTDEAVIATLEEQRRYEAHYGRPDPAPTFEPVPEGENLLWVYARNNVIYVPAVVVSDSDTIEAVHGKMNEKGFASEKLQTLDVDSTEFRMWINEKDVSFSARKEDQFSTETVTSVYDLKGNLISEGVENYECMTLIKERGFEPVVISVTTRLYWEDETTCYHAFFIVDVDEKSFLF